MSKWQVLKRLWAASAVITLLMIALGYPFGSSDDHSKNSAIPENASTDAAMGKPEPKQPDNRTAEASSAEAERAAHNPISSSDAWELCEQPIRSQLAHPSTADFNNWDTFVEHKAGSDMFTIGLTAKNSMGLELRLMGYCEIEDRQVTGAYVVERTD